MLLHMLGYLPVAWRQLIDESCLRQAVVKRPLQQMPHTHVLHARPWQALALVRLCRFFAFEPRALWSCA